MFATLAQVALGGALGSALRFLAVAALGAPWGTMAVNVGGSFLMGALAVLLAGRGAAPLVLTGVLGGFTTFSAFSLDTLRLIEDGRVPAAAAYAGGSLLLSLAAAALGLALARGILA
jgi:CrcB protein